MTSVLVIVLKLLLYLIIINFQLLFLIQDRYHMPSREICKYSTKMLSSFWIFICII